MGECECRPLGFLIGLPFALASLLLSLVGAVIWIIGSVLSCLCPCCICFAALANFAMGLIKLPIQVMQWFIDKIPC
ncbi:signaling peptide TAXIMIN 2-like [Neltuma alba]|uniref:signaling peptide TAXIMIN 2-like n=1 Tax=Neltuma alba TaxID=207710 RepID=UPI0010A54A7C|nr:signaling peptide TAXIMIN 2-like [Prosopis alba]XP_028793377.1 signaling peptide TAXIMIN 2-like [Prosopis alba]